MAKLFLGQPWLSKIGCRCPTFLRMSILAGFNLLNIAFLSKLTNSMCQVNHNGGLLWGHNHRKLCNGHELFFFQSCKPSFDSVAKTVWIPKRNKTNFSFLPDVRPLVREWIICVWGRHRRQGVGSREQGVRSREGEGAITPQPAAQGAGAEQSKDDISDSLWVRMGAGESSLSSRSLAYLARSTGMDRQQVSMDSMIA